ncbi:MAG: peptidylprolyl isomerase, partial [Candidatus Woesearchaeota archaeon]
LNGEQFDSTFGKKPLQINLGKGEVIKGFESAIIGMKLGESKRIKIPKEEAYGERMPNLVTKVPREQLLGKIVPQVGKILAVKAPYGGIMPARITDVGETHITLDLNKPLAGHDLIFEIKLEEIVNKGDIR